MATIISEEYLEKTELARELGVSPRTLDRWHVLRIGPPRTKAGKKVLYRTNVVSKWLQSREQVGPEARN